MTCGSIVALIKVRAPWQNLQVNIAIICGWYNVWIVGIGAIVFIFWRFCSCVIVIFCHPVTCSANKGIFEVELIWMHVCNLLEYQLQILRSAVSRLGLVTSKPGMSSPKYRDNKSIKTGKSTWMNLPFNSKAGEPSPDNEQNPPQYENKPSSRAHTPRRHVNVRTNRLNISL